MNMTVSVSTLDFPPATSCSFFSIGRVGGFWSAAKWEYVDGFFSDWRYDNDCGFGWGFILIGVVASDSCVCVVLSAYFCGEKKGLSKCLVGKMRWEMKWTEYASYIYTSRSLFCSMYKTMPLFRKKGSFWQRPFDRKSLCDCFPVFTLCQDHSRSEISKMHLNNTQIS